MLYSRSETYNCATSSNLTLPVFVTITEIVTYSFFVRYLTLFTIFVFKLLDLKKPDAKKQRT